MGPKAEWAIDSEPMKARGIIDGWMDDLYLNTMEIKATSLWGRVVVLVKSN